MTSIPQGSIAYLTFLERLQTMIDPIDFRLVGGALTNLLTPQTTILSLDCKKRVMTLKNHNWPTMYRKDGSLVDVDIICFCSDLRIIQDVKKNLREWERGEAKKGNFLPHVAIEPALQEKWKKKRNNLLQFVSGIDIDLANKLYLTFGNIKQEIPWKTMDKWTVVLENGMRLQTLNPYAHMFRYYMRMPSGIKPKDKNRVEKVLRPFVQEFLEIAKKQNYDYEKDYVSWNLFLSKLTTNPSLGTKNKAFLTNLYWQTVGTKFAHGKGVLHRISTLGDKFTG